jgi:hypothetical protein
MTAPDPDKDALESIARWVEGTIPLETRLEVIVRLEFPGGHVDDLPVDGSHIAAVLAHTLAREWREMGVTITTTALQQTWVLADETEITDPLPGDDD